jgi:hypothetical protein
MSDDESDEFFTYQTKELEIDDEEEDEEDEEDDEEFFGNKRKRTGVGRAAAVPKKTKQAAAPAGGGGEAGSGDGTEDHDEGAAEPSGHRVGTRRTRGDAAARANAVTISSDDSDVDDGEGGASGGARAALAEMKAEMQAKFQAVKQVAQEETVDDDDSDDDDNSAETGGAEGQKASSTDPDPSRKKVMLKLQAPGGHEVKMKTFLDEPYQKLFDQYCEQRGLDPATVYFMLVRSVQCCVQCFARSADDSLPRMCRTEKNLT